MRKPRGYLAINEKNCSANSWRCSSQGGSGAVIQDRGSSFSEIVEHAKWEQDRISSLCEKTEAYSQWRSASARWRLKMESSFPAPSVTLRIANGPSKS